jgi:anthranilate synthase component 1
MVRALGCAAEEDRSERGIERILAALHGPVPPARDRPAEPAFSPRASPDPRVYQERVRSAQEAIRRGDIFQVVLSQSLRGTTRATPFEVYRALRMLNPSPYLFYLDFAPTVLVGSSPELLVKLEGDLAMVRPIAGTRPRGEDPRTDQNLAADLLDDAKERAEHVMLVDLGRNDLGRVCRYGSVEVTDFMTVEKYSHVMHLVSYVRGRLDPRHGCFDLLRATFPAGTVSGAPKIRALEIIDELEDRRRGPYSGAVGYFGPAGEMDLCITIRTLCFHRGELVIQAGAGIVADSVPEDEHAECRRKMEALRQAVRLAEDEFA